MMDGPRVSLTPKEFELLLFFVKHPRQVFSREQLLARIWGYDFTETIARWTSMCSGCARNWGSAASW